MDPAVCSTEVCPECGIVLGSREYAGDTPFDGKHEINVTNAEGMRLVVTGGVLLEYGPCGHLIAEEPFPSIVERDPNAANLSRGREWALALRKAAQPSAREIGIPRDDD